MKADDICPGMAIESWNVGEKLWSMRYLWLSPGERWEPTARTVTVGDLASKQLATLQAGPGDNYSCLGSPVNGAVMVSAAYRECVKNTGPLPWVAEGEAAQPDAPAAPVKFREFF